MLRGGSIAHGGMESGGIPPPSNPGDQEAPIDFDARKNPQHESRRGDACLAVSVSPDYAFAARMAIRPAAAVARHHDKSK
jgi:hypothetical protein